jgi:hypothetical protein
MIRHALAPTVLLSALLMCKPLLDDDDTALAWLSRFLRKSKTTRFFLSFRNPR